MKTRLLVVMLFAACTGGGPIDYQPRGMFHLTNLFYEFDNGVDTFTLNRMTDESYLKITFYPSSAENGNIFGDASLEMWGAQNDEPVEYELFIGGFTGSYVISDDVLWMEVESNARSTTWVFTVIGYTLSGGILEGEYDDGTTYIRAVFEQ